MSKWYHSHIKENVYGILIQFVLFLSGVLFAILIPNLLSVEEFGVLSIAISVATLWTFFSSFGLNITTRQISRHLKTGKSWLYYDYLKKWKIVLTFFASITLFLFSDFIATEFFALPTLADVLKISSVWVFFFSFYGFFSQVFIAARKAKYSLVLNAIYQAGRIVFPLAFLWFSAKTANIVFIGLSVSALVATLFSFFSVERIESLRRGVEGKIDLLMVKKYVFFGALLHISDILRQNLDIIILGIFLTASAVSHYKIAMLWVVMFPFMIPFSKVVLGAAYAYEKTENSRKIFRKSIHYGFLVAFLFIVGSFCLSDDFISFFYGDEYAESALILKFLSFLSFDFVLMTSAYPVLIGRERIDSFAKIRIPTGLLQTVLSVVAILYYGLYGLVFAVVGVRLLSSFVLYRKASKNLGISVVPPIKLGFLSIIILVFLLGLKEFLLLSGPMWILLGGFLLILLYAIAALLSGSLKTRDFWIVAEPILNRFYKKP